MKTIKRKLLSLLLAMAMVLTLAPTALAADESLTLTPPTNLKIGGTTTGTIQVTGLPSGITASDATWTSDTPSVVTVSNGTVTAVSAGSATVTATYTAPASGEGEDATPAKTYSGSCTVTVAAADPVVPVIENVSVSPSTLTFDAGDADQTLTATVTGTNIDGVTPTWSVSPSGVVNLSPSSGKTITVTPITNSTAADKTATITVSAGDKTATCAVTVKASASVAVTGVTLNKNTLSLSVGGSEKLVATVTPENATDKTVSWTSSDNAVATVESDGTVRAKAVGPATITAKTTDGGFTATCAVTVTAAAGTPTITLGAPSRSSIYYIAPTAVGSSTNNTATMKMTTTGDVTDCTVTFDVSVPAAVTITPANTIAENYTITAGQVTSSTDVTIKANLVRGGQTVATSNTVSLRVNPNVVFSLTPSPSTAAVVDLSKLSSSGGYYSFSVTPSWVVAGVSQTITATNVSYEWKLNNQTLANQTTNRVSLAASDFYYGQNNKLTCAVVFKNSNGTVAGNQSAEWTINVGYSGTAYATATVSTGTSSYALGDVDDAGKTSIVDQLDNYFYNTTGGRYGLYRVTFGSVKDGNNGSLSATVGTPYYADRQGSGNNPRYLSDVLFYPGSTKTTATFPVTVEYFTSYTQAASYIASVSGTITFSVIEGAASGDITYTATLGDDVPFDQKDFEDFYYSRTRGTLNYVTFTLPSGGSLYSDGGRLSSGNACYVSPSRNQTDLAGVYFSPTGTTATRASTVRVNFTAYGNRSNSSGTVAITYLSGAAKDITYSANTTATLKVSDFTDAYRQVVGSNAPTGLTIQFQDVPTYGTLTYKDSSRTNASTVTLRASNIKNYKFTTRTSGANQLGDVTYTASGSRSDTLEYIAYVNNTPQFTGKVVFNGAIANANNMQIGYSSINGQAVTFSYSDFTKANSAVMTACSYVRFTTMPTGGTLTYNGAALSVSTNVTPTTMGNVVYRPSTGFNNNTDRITFVCYDNSGNSVGGGQVSIVVTGNAGASTGTSNVNQFKDVSATAWYRDYLSRLVTAGIIQGRGDGTFDSAAKLTYGEALKIFMLASGYPAQAETTGKDWAINYKNLAVNNGWISSTINLSDQISRNAMAELAARSLGVASSSASAPWSDGTANGYAVALYNTNPKILIGNDDGTFKGNTTLSRAEICAIACRVLDYKNAQQSLEKPGWIN